MSSVKGSNIRKRFLYGFSSKNLINILVLVIIFSLACYNVNAEPAPSGRITGKVVDAQTGEPLIGVSIYLEGTKLGAFTDLDGNYIIKNVNPGTYSLRAQMISYATITATDIVIADNEVQMNFQLSSKVYEVDDIVVKGQALKNTEAVMLKHRQAASAVSDAVSSEQISRSGSGDAAEAIKKVVGATVMDGKYVYVRGLGDRYSSTQLNGSPLPSPDPDKQAVPMDLIPANLLDNIVVQKTFTPDKPGNFSGGAVDLGTKEMPDKLSINFSTSASYNSQVKGADLITYEGSGTDWLGYDDGSRDLPSSLTNPDAIPDKTDAVNDYNKAVQLTKMSRALNDQLTPSTRRGPLNQSYAFSYGNQFRIFDKPLGIIASLSYSRKSSFYDNGFKGEWTLSGHDSVKTELDSEHELNDSRAKDEVLWGSLMNLAYRVHSNHRLGFTFMYTQNGESETRLLQGDNREMLGVEEDPDRKAIWTTRVLRYTERKLSTFQFKGEHILKGARLHWLTSFSNTNQNDPDMRFMSDHYRQRDDLKFYNLQLSHYPPPTHYFRELEEKNREGQLDLTLPFKQWSGYAAKFKFGGAYLKKERDFSEWTYEVQGLFNRYNSYGGDADAFFDEENVGYQITFDTTIVGEDIVVDTNIQMLDGGVVVNATNPGSFYKGQQNINAGYGMLDIPLFKNLKMVGGVRYESTMMDVKQTQVPGSTSEEIDEGDWLPSLNLIYGLSNKMNVRASYGRTLARPTLREIAPWASEDFVGGRTLIGNPELEITKINNYDLRWEYFERPGEIFAVSFFYKKLENPIEIAILNNNDDVMSKNVAEGKLYGAEFEVRKRLDQLFSALRNFQLGANLTLVHSEVDIVEKEQVQLETSGFTDFTRPLMGQSPYVVNVDLTYNNIETGTRATILYNVFGERLAYNAESATPDIYERPRNLLDFTLSQRMFGSMNLKFAAKNILNDEVKFSHEYKDQEFVYSSYNTGTTFTLGVTYDLGR
ncbi:MAG: TonB-dependent receptor [candidate division Zixibacteria bacterium]|nr:TonB-dependent receptor [candidate division Zixibacteria bacterium]